MIEKKTVKFITVYKAHDNIIYCFKQLQQYDYNLNYQKLC